jgi:hypothetical protein
MPYPLAPLGKGRKALSPRPFGERVRVRGKTHQSMQPAHPVLRHEQQVVTVLERIKL